MDRTVAESQDRTLHTDVGRQNPSQSAAASSPAPMVWGHCSQLWQEHQGTKERGRGRGGRESGLGLAMTVPSMHPHLWKCWRLTLPADGDDVDCIPWRKAGVGTAQDHPLWLCLPHLEPCLCPNRTPTHFQAEF